MTTYFIGCDMGGWLCSRSRDGLAVLRWDGKTLVEAPEIKPKQERLLFFPIADEIVKFIETIINHGDKCVVAIDAALAWPRQFVRLAVEASSGDHNCTFEYRKKDKQFANPYLYRETERFLVDKVRVAPLTAPGDAFGNNSSKGQVLAAWFHSKLLGLYRPPFDCWNMETAKTSCHTLIEVYPKASKTSELFTSLLWPSDPPQPLDFRDDSDLTDAKRCALTAVCYAKTVGILGDDFTEHRAYPDLYLPQDAEEKYDHELFPAEGWIFAPRTTEVMID